MQVYRTATLPATRTVRVCCLTKCKICIDLMPTLILTKGTGAELATKANRDNVIKYHRGRRLPSNQLSADI